MYLRDLEDSIFQELLPEIKKNPESSSVFESSKIALFRKWGLIQESRSQKINVPTGVLIAKSDGTLEISMNSQLAEIY